MAIMNTQSNGLTSRREFLKASALVGSALAAPSILPGSLFAKETTDTLRVGLIGCGGRGSGADGLRKQPGGNVGRLLRWRGDLRDVERWCRPL